MSCKLMSGCNSFRFIICHLSKINDCFSFLLDLRISQLHNDFQSSILNSDIYPVVN